MSFSIAVVDFVTLEKLVLKLYHSFKGATGQFNEISSQLSSFHLVMCDLRDQAENPHFLLSQHVSSDLLSMVNNLATTLRQLEDIYDRYRQTRQLNQEQLSALHEKLTIQIGLIRNYTTNLTMASVTAGAEPNGYVAPSIMRFPEPVYQNVNPRLSAEDMFTKPGKPLDMTEIIELSTCPSETSTLTPNKSDPSFQRGDGSPNQNGSLPPRPHAKSCCSLIFRDFLCGWCCGCPEFTAKDTPKILFPY